MNHFVYILKCSDGTLYTGYTNDLNRRLFEHNTSKKGARYTKQRRPVSLVWSEKHKTITSALRREAKIKGMYRRDKLSLL